MHDTDFGSLGDLKNPVLHLHSDMPWSGALLCAGHGWHLSSPTPYLYLPGGQTGKKKEKSKHTHTGQIVVYTGIVSGRPNVSERPKRVWFSRRKRINIIIRNARDDYARQEYLAKHLSGTVFSYPYSLWKHRYSVENHQKGDAYIYRDSPGYLPRPRTLKISN